MNLKLIYPVLLFFTIFGSSRVFAQYQVLLKNDTLTSDNQYDFDIYIKSQTGSINLTAYQFIFTMNDSIIQKRGELSFDYIQNSSQLINVPKHVRIIEDRGVQNLAIASDPGRDSICCTDYVRIGSFRISDKNPFGNFKTDVEWDFGGLIKSEVNINDTNRIIQSNYINSLRNPLFVITDVNGEKAQTSKFELFQNYPNPFNPETEIRFSLPGASKVKLNIYNIIGQHVASLINKTLAAGYHNVIFNGRNLPSGIYIYRLQTNSFVQTKKMILLK